jgi:hypothetical protein
MGVAAAADDAEAEHMQMLCERDLVMVRARPSAILCPLLCV